MTTASGRWRGRDVCRVAFCVLLATSVTSPLAAKPAATGGGAKQADERRENRAVREAQDDLDDAQKSAREAERAAADADRDLRAAVAARHSAAIAMKKTSDALEEEHADSSGLTAARATWKELQDDTADIPPERKAELRKAATERIEAAQATLDRAVARDPALKKAQDAFEKARSAEMLATRKLEKASSALSSARSRLARAHQALAARKAADQRDTNRPQREAKGKNQGRKN